MQLRSRSVNYVDGRNGVVIGPRQQGQDDAEEAMPARPKRAAGPGMG